MSKETVGDISIEPSCPVDQFGGEGLLLLEASPKGLSRSSVLESSRKLATISATAVVETVGEEKKVWPGQLEKDRTKWMGVICRRPLSRVSRGLEEGVEFEEHYRLPDQLEIPHMAMTVSPSTTTSALSPPSTPSAKGMEVGENDWLPDAPNTVSPSSTTSTPSPPSTPCTPPLM